MKRFGKLLILWFVMGEQYFVLEALWRLFTRGERAHPAMLIVGGFCIVAIGAINQTPRFYKLPVLLQSVIGSLITLVIEFVSGCVLNLWMGLNIWDYSHLWGNLYGQICIVFALVWLVLMPTAIWMEDAFRYYVWGEGKLYSFRHIYWEMITFQ